MNRVLKFANFPHQPYFIGRHVERAATVGKAKCTDAGMHAQLKSICAAHHNHIHCLIMETESFDEPSSQDQWADCERPFKNELVTETSC